MGKNVKAELLGGFRDYLPAAMISRQAMLDKIQAVFERFGFLPLDTPALERSAVLGTDDRDFSMEVYRFMAGDQDVSLRFDLTVPLARVMAANPDLPRPFKRFQVGKVWRKEKPQAGRFREFMQFDADTVGSSSMLADTEIIQLMYQTLTELGVANFQIKVNNRKILNGLPELAGFDADKTKVVLRILDKLEKIGQEEVVEELKRQPDNRFDTEAPALSDQAVAKILEFLSISGDDGSMVEKLTKLFRGIKVAEEGIDEIKQIFNNLKVAEIPSSAVKFDLSVSRGLDYYTGPVFETSLLEIPEIGSVFSGGRYDNLVSRFTGSSLPATGASIGVDRLFAALEKLGRIETRPTLTNVLVTVFSAELASDSIVLANQLRSQGFNVELYLGSGGFKAQFNYAVRQEIPFVCIIGPDEKANGLVKLRDMKKRTEVSLKAGLIPSWLMK